MWKQVLFAYHFVVVGAAFASLGAFLLGRHLLPRRQTQPDTAVTDAPAIKVAGVLCLCVGLFLLALGWVGPSPTQRWNMMASVLDARAEDIDAVDLIPRAPYDKKCPLKSPVTINERQEINRLCDTFRRAQSHTPSHPKVVWELELVMHKPDGNHRCLVSATTNNGVLIDFAYEGGTMRFPVGTFRCDDLSELIRSWAGEPLRK